MFMLNTARFKERFRNYLRYPTEKLNKDNEKIDFIYLFTVCFECE